MSNDYIHTPGHYIYHSSFENKQEMGELLSYIPQLGIDFEISQEVIKNSHPYFTETARFPLMTKKGEKHFFTKMNYYRYQALNSELRAELNVLADQTRGLIIEHNLRLVIHIAKTFVIKNMSMDEIISNGNISLIRAADYFDVNRLNKHGGTNKFSTYATWAIIRGFITDRDRNDTRMNSHYDISEYQVADPRSIIDPIRDNSEYITELITSSLLTSTERAIVQDSFEIFCGEDRSWEVIGRRHGLCAEHARQICSQACVKMRLAYQLEFPSSPFFRIPRCRRRISKTRVA